MFKALKKQSQTFDGMLDVRNFFLNLNQLAAAKKYCKNGKSQQSFGPSYFVMALASIFLDVFICMV